MAHTDRIEYNKRPLSLEEQIEKLKKRGLDFENETEAKNYLFNISYYRLRAYTYPFQDNSEGNDHRFTRNGITFYDIINTSVNF